jgi:uncharacterized tellurite resistance protein B-like protein
MSFSTNKNKQLLEILVAAAWIDGEFQPEEQQYLSRIAQEQQLNEDVEIQELLSNTRPISSAKCYQLLKNYLGDRPTLEDYNDLLSAISTLVYSDGDIATEEAKLLTQLQELDPNNSASNSTLDKILSRIQKLYKKGLASVD